VPLSPFNFPLNLVAHTLGPALVAGCPAVLKPASQTPLSAILLARPRKRVGLELGNNAPLIVESDGDWRTAVAKVKVVGFSHAGQSCISAQRIFVHSAIAEDVIAALMAARTRDFGVARHDG